MTVQQNADYERWVASTKGTVAHLWTPEGGTSSSLCGQAFHRDAYLANYDTPTCKRCERQLCIDGKDA